MVIGSRLSTSREGRSEASEIVSVTSDSIYAGLLTVLVLVLLHCFCFLEAVEVFFDAFLRFLPIVIRLALLLALLLAMLMVVITVRSGRETRQKSESNPNW